MPVQNALGKYGHAVTAGVVALLLVSWVVVQVGGALGVVGRPAPQLDTFALAAFTYLLGNVSALNGLKPDITAAHKRLDVMGAPAAGVVDAVLDPQLRAGHLAGLHTAADPRCPLCGHDPTTPPEASERG